MIRRLVNTISRGGRGGGAMWLPKWQLLLLVWAASTSISTVTSTTAYPDELQQRQDNADSPSSSSSSPLRVLQTTARQPLDGSRSSTSTSTSTSSTISTDTSPAFQHSFHRAIQADDDISLCYDALFLADENRDRRVDKTEYIQFLQMYGPEGFLGDQNSFEDIPLILKSNFIILACLCLQDGSDPGCCVGDKAHIRNDGAYPDEIPTPAQRRYLYQACFLTETSIERVLESMAPQPTPAPVSPTEAPVVPTSTPTVAPVVVATPSPTVAPTARPEAAPTEPPSPMPTEVPTVAPTTSAPTSSPITVTVAPTAAPFTSAPTHPPSPGPSPVPTAAPTKLASFGPTNRPTSDPTATPTMSSQPTSPAPTKGPTAAPSTMPSSGPTNGPTMTLTLAPTVHPSPTPTLAPTADPSPTPSAAPSAATAAPTKSASPSDVPTSPPTSSPTLTPEPTTSPSSTPSTVPTLSLAPSTNPSSPPTERPPPDAVAKAYYVVAVTGGANLRDYVGDLELAMDILAPKVAAGLNNNNSNSSVRRRRLTVSVDLPTSLDGVIAAICPESIDENNRCEDVSASIGLFVTDDEDPEAVLAQFESDLETAILNQELQDALYQVNPNTPVFIITGMDSIDKGTAGDDSAADDNGLVLSAGAISGIVVIGVIGVILMSFLFARRRTDPADYYLKQNESVDFAEEILPIDTTIPSSISAPQHKNNHSRVQNTGSQDMSIVMAASSASQYDDYSYVGPTIQTSADQSDKSQATPPMVTKLPPITPQQQHREREHREHKGDDSSNAGSSGWSSRDAMSSLDSSIDEDHTGGLAAPSGGGTGNSLADICANSSLVASSSRDSEPSIQMTYSELDQAIQQGDWAAVGVTAALLASQSYDTTDKKVNFQGTLNPTRAAELDRLVEAGDWAGVVAAAAKYDAQETVVGDNSRGESGSSRGGSSRALSSSALSSALSSGDGSSGSVGDGESTGTGLSAGSGTTGMTGSVFTSTGTTASDSNSRVKKLDEIRAEVEQLVEHVVPEEKDNVDEMMMQFRGREEELVETLRSMQERAVASKARVEGQKRAKQTARQSRETSKQVEQTTMAVDNTGKPADDDWMASIENTPADDSNDSSGFDRTSSVQLEPPQEEDEDNEVKEIQDTLKEAIENENWDAVAEAASGLSGRHVDDSSASQTSHSDSTSVSERSTEINALVDKGDWDGVVAAASKYNDIEKDQLVDTGDAATQEERRLRRQKQLEKEEEALAEADIWDAIAKQTKTEAAQSDVDENKAAKEAAHWAIARSLSALQKSDAHQGSSDGGDEQKDETEDEEEGTI